MTLHELIQRGIPFWADNDGGLWYWDADGRAQQVKEEHHGKD